MEIDQLRQFKDFILNYNKLSELCFNDCIYDFTMRAVSPQEQTCASNCVEKFLKANQRISQRFQESQMNSSEKTQGKTMQS
jgi:import inner membrane translocase subunit TIM9